MQTFCKDMIPLNLSPVQYAIDVCREDLLLSSWRFDHFSVSNKQDNRQQKKRTILFYVRYTQEHATQRKAGWWNLIEFSKGMRVCASGEGDLRHALEVGGRLSTVSSSVLLCRWSLPCDSPWGPLCLGQGSDPNLFPEREGLEAGVTSYQKSRHYLAEVRISSF